MPGQQYPPVISRTSIFIGWFTMKKKSLTAIFAIILTFPPGGLLQGAISEKQLQKNNERMLAVLLRENPHHHDAIQRLIRLYIGEKRSGARLIDRMGIFLQDCRNNKIDIMRARFYHGGGEFSIFYKLKDRQDEQLYLLFLQYRYNLKTRSCLLTDISFGPDFREKRDTLRRLFNNEGSIEEAPLRNDLPAAVEKRDP